MGKGTKYENIVYSEQWSLPFAPKAKERARTFFAGRRYRSVTPIATRAAESNIRHFVFDKRPIVPLEQPIKVVLVFFVERPKKPKFKDLPAVKPDIDNMTKLVFDACNDVIWRDDSLIVDLVVFKRYAVGPPKIWLSVKTK